MSTTPASVPLIKKTYKYFDLASFTEVKEEVEIPFVPASDFNEAVQRLDGAADKILKALNDALQRMAFSDARKSIATKGASKKVVFDLIRPMRNMEPWASNKDRKGQTKMLLDLVRSTPQLMESVRVTSLKAAEADDDDDAGDEE